VILGADDVVSIGQDRICLQTYQSPFSLMKVNAPEVSKGFHSPAEEFTEILCSLGCCSQAFVCLFLPFKKAKSLTMSMILAHRKCPLGWRELEYTPE